MTASTAVAPDVLTISGLISISVIIGRASISIHLGHAALTQKGGRGDPAPRQRCGMRLRSRPGEYPPGVIGDIGRIKPGGDGLGLNLPEQVHAQMPGSLDPGLVREKLPFDKDPRRFHDHLLFVGQGKIHGLTLPLPDTTADGVGPW